MLSLMTASPPRAGRSRAPLHALVLLAASLLAPPALADPPIPIDSAQTAPVTLRYGYRAGETVPYRVTVNEETTLSDVTTSRRFEFTIGGSLRLSLIVQRVDDAGNMVVAEEVRDANLEVDGQGLGVSTRELNRSLSGVGRTIELSPQGELLDEEFANTRASDGLGLMAFELARLGEAVRLQLPTHELEVGGSFFYEGSRGDATQGAETRFRLDYTFAGWSQIGTRRCAVFEISGDAWTEVSEGASAGNFAGPSLVRGVHRGWLYFDPTAGRIVRAEVEVGSVGQVRFNGSTLDLIDMANWTIELVQ